MRGLNALKITQRYTLVLAAYWISLLGVIGMSWWGLMDARNSLRHLHEESLQRILLADSMNDSTLQSRTMMLLAFQHAPENPLSSLHDHPVQSHLQSIRESLERNQQIRGELLSKTTDEQEHAMLGEVVRVQDLWQQSLNTYIRAIEGGDYSNDLMARFLASGRDEAETLVALVGAFKGLQVSKSDMAYQQAAQRYQWSIVVFLAAILLGGLPATVLSIMLLRRMQHGFDQAQKSAAAIAQGDLSQTVAHEGKDEIAALLSHMEVMRLHLHDIIAQVRAGADAIAGASTQVAAGTQDLSARTEQQAAALEQTASATEQLSGTVQNNADSASSASQLAAQATGVAQQGGTMVAQVVQTMEDINKSSRRIEDIIAVIDGIAFQTNILALNAAVEAARAGEQGRGFAVVAGEVRSLAKRSAEAAKEVKDLITASVDSVRVGSEQVNRTGATMQDIVSSIQRVADIVEEIASASREQAGGLEQINSAVSSLDDVTQQNAALVEETSAASSALQEQARQLALMASNFVLQDSSRQPVAQPRPAGPASLGGGAGSRPIPRATPAQVSAPVSKSHDAFEMF